MTMDTTRSRRGLRRRVCRWVALLACGAVALSGCDVYDIPLPGGADVGDQPITVHARFRDVLDLVPQSTVKLNDVTVGKVTAIDLKGYTADVTMEIRGDRRLPANERADIRQTSLLGEKFVSLDEPNGPARGRLTDGDVIPLSRTGRNPAVEEVLKALSAVLNGGGVAQLKTIAHELNTAAGGREQDIRSVLDQLHYFMGQLDRNKAAIVRTIDNVDRLARELHRQDGTIKLALDDLPAAIRSVKGQRADLVRMLKALDRLSGVGVRVIKASKEATIDSLRDLAPVLSALARAGSSLPRSLQVSLTYPFVDAAVGNSPQVARNLHMGDYTNLSIRMNLDLGAIVAGLPGVGETLDIVCKKLSSGAGGKLDKLCSALPTLPSVPTPKLPRHLKDLLHGGKGGSGSGGGGNGPLGGLLGKPGSGGATTGPGTSSGGGSGSGTGGGLLGPLGLGRAAPGPWFVRPARPDDPFGLRERGYDPGVGTLLLQGVAAQ